MSEIVVVVPCYNEEKRLDIGEFARLASHPRISLLFVDDGSTDGTLDILERACRSAGDPSSESSGSMGVLALEENSGKAEAVRQGMLKALATEASIVGFIDADLATPVDEVLRLCEEARSGDAVAVIGARVALSGRNIKRSPLRHYLSRIFSTTASIVLGAAIYDTQCGAKFFRNSPATRAALSEPFNSRWAFDVEFLGRMFAGTPEVSPISADELIEVPLKQWIDVAGSKVTFKAMLRALLDLGIIGRDLRQRRRHTNLRS